MAPALLLRRHIGMFHARRVSEVESAWETRASWRQVPLGFAVGTPKGMKSAPLHRDFAAGKVEVYQ